MPPFPAKTDDVPHVWYTKDQDGGECRHLAMGEVGAVQAHLLHHGMVAYPGDVSARDEGRITVDTDRNAVCMDYLCVFYGLSFSGADDAPATA